MIASSGDRAKHPTAFYLWLGLSAVSAWVGGHVAHAAQHVPAFARLVTHLFGEHLGQWQRGIRLLEGLRRLPAFCFDKSISYSTPSMVKLTVSSALVPSRSSTSSVMTRCMVFLLSPRDDSY